MRRRRDDKNVTTCLKAWIQTPPLLREVVVQSDMQMTRKVFDDLFWQVNVQNVTRRLTL